MQKTNKIVKAISAVVASTFMLQSVGFAASDIQPMQLPMFQKPMVSLDLPKSVALISDSYEADSRLRGNDKMVILLQDAHTNESAQMNIARSLDLMMQKDPALQYVFLEAGTGNDSLSFLRDKADLKKRQQIGREFMRKGYLSGSEYLDLTSSHDMVLWGVEDKKLYWEAVESYGKVAQKRDKFQAHLAQVGLSIETLKPQIFGPSLSDFDAKRESYLSEKLSLTDYLDVLMKQADIRSLAITHYPHLVELSKLKEQEKAIDFNKANEEQQKAVSSLSKEDIELLKDAATGKEDRSPFKVGSADHKIQKAYYALLEEKLAQRTADSGQRTGLTPDSSTLTPELMKYFAYLKAAEKIDPKSILEEQKLLEEKVYDSLIKTQDERSLHEATESLRFLKGLFNLTLTPDEYRHYKKNKDRYSIVNMTGFLNRKIMDFRTQYERVVFLEEGYEDYVKIAERYYQLTYERDFAFLDNMLTKMKESNQKTSALITGGYHTPNLTALLRDKNISYIVVTPQVLQETNLKKYEQVLLSQEESHTVTKSQGHKEARHPERSEGSEAKELGISAMRGLSARFAMLMLAFNISVPAQAAMLRQNANPPNVVPVVAAAVQVAGLAQRGGSLEISFKVGVSTVLSDGRINTAFEALNKNYLLAKDEVLEVEIGGVSGVRSIDTAIAAQPAGPANGEIGRTLSQINHSGDRSVIYIPAFSDRYPVLISFTTSKGTTPTIKKASVIKSTAVPEEFQRNMVIHVLGGARLAVSSDPEPFTLEENSRETSQDGNSLVVKYNYKSRGRIALSEIFKRALVLRNELGQLRLNISHSGWQINSLSVERSHFPVMRRGLVLLLGPEANNMYLQDEESVSFHYKKVSTNAPIRTRGARLAASNPITRRDVLKIGGGVVVAAAVGGFGINKLLESDPYSPLTLDEITKDDSGEEIEPTFAFYAKRWDLKVSDHIGEHIIFEMKTRPTLFGVRVEIQADENSQSRSVSVQREGTEPYVITEGNAQINELQNGVIQIIVPINDLNRAGLKQVERVQVWHGGRGTIKGDLINSTPETWKSLQEPPTVVLSKNSPAGARLAQMLALVNTLDGENRGVTEQSIAQALQSEPKLLTDIVLTLGNLGYTDATLKFIATTITQALYNNSNLKLSRSNLEEIFNALTTILDVDSGRGRTGTLIAGIITQALVNDSTLLADLVDVINSSNAAEKYKKTHSQISKVIDETLKYSPERLTIMINALTTRRYSDTTIGFVADSVTKALKFNPNHKPNLVDLTTMTKALKIHGNSPKTKRKIEAVIAQAHKNNPKLSTSRGSRLSTQALREIDVQSLAPVMDAIKVMVDAKQSGNADQMKAAKWPAEIYENYNRKDPAALVIAADPTAFSDWAKAYHDKYYMNQLVSWPQGSAIQTLGLRALDMGTIRSLVADGILTNSPGVQAYLANAARGKYKILRSDLPDNKVDAFANAYGISNADEIRNLGPKQQLFNTLWAPWDTLVDIANSAYSPEDAKTHMGYLASLQTSSIANAVTILLSLPQGSSLETILLNAHAAYILENGENPQALYSWEKVKEYPDELLRDWNGIEFVMNALDLGDKFPDIQFEANTLILSRLTGSEDGAAEAGREVQVTKRRGFSTVVVDSPTISIPPAYDDFKVSITEFAWARYGKSGIELLLNKIVDALSADPGMPGVMGPASFISKAEGYMGEENIRSIFESSDPESKADRLEVGVENNTPFVTVFYVRRTGFNDPARARFNLIAKTWHEDALLANSRDGARLAAPRQAELEDRVAKAIGSISSIEAAEQLQRWLLDSNRTTFSFVPKKYAAAQTLLRENDLSIRQVASLMPVDSASPYRGISPLHMLDGRIEALSPKNNVIPFEKPANKTSSVTPARRVAAAVAAAALISTAAPVASFGQTQPTMQPYLYSQIQSVARGIINQSQSRGSLSITDIVREVKFQYETDAKLTGQKPSDKEVWAAVTELITREGTELQVTAPVQAAQTVTSPAPIATSATSLQGGIAGSLAGIGVGVGKPVEPTVVQQTSMFMAVPEVSSPASSAARVGDQVQSSGGTMPEAPPALQGEIFIAGVVTSAGPRYTYYKARLVGNVTYNDTVVVKDENGTILKEISLSESPAAVSVVKGNSVLGNWGFMIYHERNIAGSQTDDMTFIDLTTLTARSIADSHEISGPIQGLRFENPEETNPGLRRVILGEPLSPLHQTIQFSYAHKALTPEGLVDLVENVTYVIGQDGRTSGISLGSHGDISLILNMASRPTVRSGSPDARDITETIVYVNRNTGEFVAGGYTVGTRRQGRMYFVSIRDSGFMEFPDTNGNVRVVFNLVTQELLLSQNPILYPAFTGHGLSAQTKPPLPPDALFPGIEVNASYEMTTQANARTGGFADLDGKLRRSPAGNFIEQPAGISIQTMPDGKLDIKSEDGALSFVFRLAVINAEESYIRLLQGAYKARYNFNTRTWTVFADNSFAGSLFETDSPDGLTRASIEVREVFVPNQVVPGRVESLVVRSKSTAVEMYRKDIDRYPVASADPNATPIHSKLLTFSPNSQLVGITLEYPAIPRSDANNRSIFVPYVGYRVEAVAGIEQGKTVDLSDAIIAAVRNSITDPMIWVAVMRVVLNNEGANVTFSVAHGPRPTADNSAPFATIDAPRTLTIPFQSATTESYVIPVPDSTRRYFVDLSPNEAIVARSEGIGNVGQLAVWRVKPDGTIGPGYVDTNPNDPSYPTIQTQLRAELNAILQLVTLGSPEEAAVRKILGWISDRPHISTPGLSANTWSIGDLKIYAESNAKEQRSIVGVYNRVTLRDENYTIIAGNQPSVSYRVSDGVLILDGTSVDPIIQSNYLEALRNVLENLGFITKNPSAGAPVALKQLEEVYKDLIARKATLSDFRVQGDPGPASDPSRKVTEVRVNGGLVFVSERSASGSAGVVTSVDPITGEIIEYVIEKHPKIVRPYDADYGESRQRVLGVLDRNLSASNRVVEGQDQVEKVRGIVNNVQTGQFPDRVELRDFYYSDPSNRARYMFSRHGVLVIGDFETVANYPWKLVIIDSIGGVAYFSNRFTGEVTIEPLSPGHVSINHAELILKHVISTSPLRGIAEAGRDLQKDLDDLSRALASPTPVTPTTPPIIPDFGKTTETVIQNQDGTTTWQHSVGSTVVYADTPVPNVPNQFYRVVYQNGLPSRIFTLDTSKIASGTNGDGWSRLVTNGKIRILREGWYHHGENQRGEDYYIDSHVPGSFVYDRAYFKGGVVIANEGFDVSGIPSDRTDGKYWIELVDKGVIVRLYLTKVSGGARLAEKSGVSGQEPADREPSSIRRSLPGGADYTTIRDSVLASATRGARLTSSFGEPTHEIVSAVMADTDTAQALDAFLASSRGEEAARSGARFAAQIRGGLVATFKAILAGTAITLLSVIGSSTAEARTVNLATVAQVQDVFRGVSQDASIGSASEVVTAIKMAAQSDPVTESVTPIAIGVPVSHFEDLSEDEKRVQVSLMIAGARLAQSRNRMLSFFLVGVLASTSSIIIDEAARAKFMSDATNFKGITVIATNPSDPTVVGKNVLSSPTSGVRGDAVTNWGGAFIDAGNIGASYQPAFDPNTGNLDPSKVSYLDYRQVVDTRRSRTSDPSQAEDGAEFEAVVEGDASQEAVARWAFHLPLAEAALNILMQGARLMQRATGIAA